MNFDDDVIELVARAHFEFAHAQLLDESFNWDRLDPHDRDLELRATRAALHALGKAVLGGRPA